MLRRTFLKGLAALPFVKLPAPVPLVPEFTEVYMDPIFGSGQAVIGYTLTDTYRVLPLRHLNCRCAYIPNADQVIR